MNTYHVRIDEKQRINELLSSTDLPLDIIEFEIETFLKEDTHEIKSFKTIPRNSKLEFKNITKHYCQFCDYHDSFFFCCVDCPCMILFISSTPLWLPCALWYRIIFPNSIDCVNWVCKPNYQFNRGCLYDFCDFFDPTHLTDSIPDKHLPPKDMIMN